MSKKILIADDELSVAKMLGKGLQAHGYQVMTAVDGVQAVKLAHQARPDLILLDIKMPGQNGYTVFKNLKMSTHTMLIPIIFMSALPWEQVEEATGGLRAQDFIHKPFHSQEVVAKLREIRGE